jgi:methylmalonyl-CoA epimerase
MKLDHIGIAVRSLNAAMKFYHDTLGIPLQGFENIRQEKVRVAMLPLGETRVELLEGTSEDSLISRFLEKRGEGLHHIAIEVEHIEEHVAKLATAGVRLATPRVQEGAGGHRYVFIHPLSTGGVLVELVEAKAK